MKNKTIFVRVQKKENYTVILNSLIDSTSITSEEKNILFYILHLPDTWSLCKEIVARKFSPVMGEAKFAKAWRGLKNKGFIQSRPLKNAQGKLGGWEHTIYEQPKPEPVNSECSENRSIEELTSRKTVPIISTNETITKVINTKEGNTDSSIILVSENSSFKDICLTSSEESRRQQGNSGVSISELFRRKIVAIEDRLLSEFPQYPMLVYMASPVGIQELKFHVDDVEHRKAIRPLLDALAEARMKLRGNYKYLPNPRRGA